MADHLTVRIGTNASTPDNDHTGGRFVRLDSEGSDQSMDMEAITTAAIVVFVVGILMFILGIIACLVFPAIIAGAIFVLSGMLVVAGAVLCGIIECSPEPAN